MKKIVGISFLSVALIALTVLPVTVSAGQSGNMNMNQSQNRTQPRNQYRQQLRYQLRDGSCLDQTTTASGAMNNKKGNTYGPGDGTGNDHIGPQDGTGFGAP
ncbi:MAG: hypothetical protein A2Y66_03070 [Nitrospirae bacterium RBG_13_41_22]|nr:MAG: hypothetical protein A2Y66_03070 [Nitrospirae bacterium RBG_13_41_22]OHE55712.1 MAG: hypothetical protein A2Z47_05175 [Thermodesulfovibrio sp. RBG_19FT_COMBO_42_12]